MSELGLNCQGVRTLVRAHGAVAEEVLNRLAMDFAYFREGATDAAEPLLTIELGEGGGERELGLRPLFRTRMCRVYGWGRERFCDYGDGLTVSARNRPGARAFFLSGREADALHEVAYGLLLSTIGEELDRRGFHRIHAAGLDVSGRTVLVVTRPGVGKSTLTASLMKEASVGILSDESPILYRGRAHPFPVRMALRPEHAAIYRTGEEGRPFRRRIFAEKMLFPIPRGRVAGPAHLGAILLGRPAAGQPRIVRASRWAVFRVLFVEMVIGSGLAQMAEHMLRANAVHRLALIAGSRLREAIRLAWAVPGYRFDMVSDSDWNSRVLRSHLESADGASTGPAGRRDIGTV